MVRREQQSNVIEPSERDLEQLQTILRTIGGPNVQWGAVNKLEVWLAETRLEAERLATRRMLVATWVLAAATVALVFATVGLIVAGTA